MCNFCFELCFQVIHDIQRLIQECKIIAKELNIINELESEQIGCKEFKMILKKEIKNYNEKVLRHELKDLKKLEEYKEEPYERKQYLKNLTLEEIRTKFRMRTKMIDAKFNYKNKSNYRRELWMCDSCKRAIESQSHLLWCPAYQHLREGKSLDSDKDLTQYIINVLQYRDDLDEEKKKKEKNEENL